MKIKNLRYSPILRAFFTTTVGSGISKIILVVATFFCARLLSKDEFGAFSFVRNTLNTILCIGALNYIGLCTKFTAELKHSDVARKRLTVLVGFSLFICFFGGGLLLLLPASVIIRMVDDASLVTYFRMIGALLPLFMLQPLVEGMLRGKEKFRLISTMQVVSSLGFFGLVVAGIYWKGVAGAVYGLLAYYLLYSAYSLFMLNRMTALVPRIRTAVHGWRSELSIISKMVLPVFFLSFIDAPINWWAQLLLAREDSFGAVGSMTAILQLRNVIILIPSYFFSTFTVFASTLNASGNYPEYFAKFRHAMGYIGGGSILGAVVFILFDKNLLGLYGPEYIADTRPFLIAMGALPLFTLSSLLKVNLLVREHQRMMLAISIVSSGLFILSLYGLLATGIGSVSAYFAAQFLQVGAIFVWCLLIYRNDRKNALL